MKMKKNKSLVSACANDLDVKNLTTIDILQLKFSEQKKILVTLSSIIRWYNLCMTHSRMNLVFWYNSNSNRFECINMIFLAAKTSSLSSLICLHHHYRYMLCIWINIQISSSWCVFSTFKTLMMIILFNGKKFSNFVSWLFFLVIISSLELMHPNLLDNVILFFFSFRVFLSCC